AVERQDRNPRRAERLQDLGDPPGVLGGLPIVDPVAQVQEGGRTEPLAHRRRELGQQSERDVPGADRRVGAVVDVRDQAEPERHRAHGVRRARTTASPVIGSSVRRFPVAAATALAIAAGTATTGGSPTPFAPNGPCADGTSTSTASIGGTWSLCGRG